MSSEESNNWGLKVYMPKPTSHDTTADAKVRAAERAADFADKRTEAHRLEIRRLTNKVAALQEDLVDLLTERKDLRTQLGLSAAQEKAARGEIIGLMIDGLQALGIDCSDDPTTDHDPILFVARHLRQLGTAAHKTAPEPESAPANARGRAFDKVEITRGRLAALEAIEEWAAGALRREAVSVDEALGPDFVPMPPARREALLNDLVGPDDPELESRIDAVIAHTHRSEDDSPTIESMNESDGWIKRAYDRWARILLGTTVKAIDVEKNTLTLQGHDGQDLVVQLGHMEAAR